MEGTLVIIRSEKIFKKENFPKFILKGPNKQSIYDSNRHDSYEKCAKNHIISTLMCECRVEKDEKKKNCVSEIRSKYPLKEMRNLPISLISFLLYEV